MTCLLRTTYVTYVTYDVILLINKMLWKEDRVLIKVLRVENGYGAKRIKTKFPGRNLSLSSVKRLLHQSDTTASADRKSGSGRRRTARCGTNETVALLSAETPDFWLHRSTVLATEQRRPQSSWLCGLQSGAFCKSESTVAGSVTSTIWKNDWLQNGADLTRTSLTELSTSSGSDCVGVSERTEDTLSIKFKRSDYLTWQQLCLLIEFWASFN